jgi:hypothetical protein
VRARCDARAGRVAAGEAQHRPLSCRVASSQPEQAHASYPGRVLRTRRREAARARAGRSRLASGNRLRFSSHIGRPRPRPGSRRLRSPVSAALDTPRRRPCRVHFDLAHVVTLPQHVGHMPSSGRALALRPGQARVRLTWMLAQRAECVGPAGHRQTREVRRCARARGPP